MKDLSTISSDLFNKVRSRFSDIKIGDEEGAVTTDPNDARFFDLNYSVNGEDLGRVNIKIDDEALTVIYNEAMCDGQPEDVRNKWFAFLKELRQFARKNLLTFDTRDIAKSNLEKRDYAYLAQSTGESNMSESKLFGTSKTSYQDMGEAKIIVKHSQPVNYALPAGRTQHIEAIYIESANGERFRYPARHLNGARAMARHVANGGTAYDAVGQYISGLSEELSKLRQFKNYTHRSGVMAEALGDITEKVAERIEGIKAEVASLQKQSYYEQFAESFAPSESREVPEEMASSWIDALTIKTFNEELKAVFPYIYKLVGENNGIGYEDLVKEGTCPVCNEDPCSCEEEVEENADMFDAFVQGVEELATPTFEADDEKKNDEEPPFDPDPKPSKKVTPGKHGQGYSQARHLARQGMKKVIPQEVVEFIASMYDRENGTFPRGEEGVKIACEKKFGEQAGQFAHYVVEKLSSQGQAMQEDGGSAEDILAGIAHAEDWDALYDMHKNLGRPGPEGEAARIIDDMYSEVAREIGAHADDDFEAIYNRVLDQLIDQYASGDEGGETDDNYALASAGFGSDEDYGSYDESSELVSIKRLAGI